MINNFMSKISTIRNLTDSQLINLVDEHKSITAILEHLIGYGYDPRCRKLLKAKAEKINIIIGSKPQKHYRYSDDEFREVVKNEICLIDVAKTLGLSVHSNNYTTLRTRIKKLNIDTSHFKSREAMGRGQTRYTEDEIFCENSNYSRTGLPAAIIKYNVLEYKCSGCEFYKLYGDKLKLQVDHINGDSRDHSKSNLRYLCPNCHSMTETYCRITK